MRRAIWRTRRAPGPLPAFLRARPHVWKDQPIPNKRLVEQESVTTPARTEHLSAARRHVIGAERRGRGASARFAKGQTPRRDARPWQSNRNSGTQENWNGQAVGSRRLGNPRRSYRVQWAGRARPDTAE